MLAYFVPATARQGWAPRILVLLHLALGLGLLAQLSGCARPTLEEAERELNGEAHDAGAGRKGGSTATSGQQHDSHSSGSPHHDSGTSAVHEPDSGTPASHDAGPPGTSGEPDAGSPTTKNPSGCPAQKPAPISGHICKSTLTCQYGSTTCTCVIFGTWGCLPL